MEKCTLLYVDDEESNLRIFKDSFRRKYNVYTASSAKEGIILLDTHEVDLVLSDQRMPEMTGVEFLKYSLEKYPEPNRILITGYSDLEAIQGAINQAHIFQYIQKPWNNKDLETIIDRALLIYKLEKENEQQKYDLQIAKERAEESDKLKTEFLHNLSHEIRTPMNAIHGFSEFLDRTDIPEDEQKSYIRIIKDSSMQLLKIITDILEISQLSTSKIIVKKEMISLNEIVEDVSSDFAEMAEEKKLTMHLRKELSNGKDYIETDKKLLQKILFKLVENAILHTDKGHVEIGYFIENDILKIYVKDTGKGIDPNNHEIIFNRFSHESVGEAHNSGLGLGLPIAEESAKLLNGKITLESEKGKGSTFFLTIPITSEKK